MRATWFCVWTFIAAVFLLLRIPAADAAIIACLCAPFVFISLLPDSNYDWDDDDEDDEGGGGSDRRPDDPNPEPWWPSGVSREREYDRV